MAMLQRAARPLGVLARPQWRIASRAFGGASGGGQMGDIENVVESTISDNAITVFSKTYCPYCRQAKSAIEAAGHADKMKVLELDEMGSEGAEIQSFLLQKTGQRTVPNVFVKGQHIGESVCIGARGMQWTALCL